MVTKANLKTFERTTKVTTDQSGPDQEVLRSSNTPWGGPGSRPAPGPKGEGMLGAVDHKSFPGEGLDEVSVSFAPGTIHALLGENGAGKSTLMRIISGIRPDRGQMFLDGRPLQLRRAPSTPWPSRIGIVHQEIQVLPRASVAGEHHAGQAGPTSAERPRRRLEGHAPRGGCAYMEMVDLDRRSRDDPVAELSAAHKQLAQTARALLRWRGRSSSSTSPHILPHPARGRPPLRAPAQAARPGGHHRSSSPTSSRGSWRSATWSPCCGTAASSARIRGRSSPRTGSSR